MKIKSVKASVGLFLKGRKSFMKIIVKRYIFGVIATAQLQPLFQIMYRFSLWSMNIGLGGGTKDSGEDYALNHFAKNNKFKTNFVVFDVGANMGQFTKVVLKTIGSNARIYAFEPSPSAFKNLEKNISEYPNIKLNNLGLGELDAKVTLYSEMSASGHASLYRRTIAGEKMQLTESIKIKTLDSFCIDNNINHIHYLKMDVEGHELSVLKGAKQMLASSGIDCIQFEFGGCNIDSRTYFRDFFELLNPQYKIYRLVRNGLIPINFYHETQEVFSTTNFIAIARH